MQSGVDNPDLPEITQSTACRALGFEEQMDGTERVFVLGTNSPHLPAIRTLLEDALRCARVMWCWC